MPREREREGQEHGCIIQRLVGRARKNCNDNDQKYIYIYIYIKSSGIPLLVFLARLCSRDR